MKEITSNLPMGPQPSAGKANRGGNKSAAADALAGRQSVADAKGKAVPEPVVQQESQPQKLDLVEITKRANDQLKASGRSVQFQVHEGTGDTVIRVVDSQTNEVVRQIPPESLLRMASFIEAAMQEDGSPADVNSVGLDEKV